MVLLSGKRKSKENTQKIIDDLIDPYLEFRHQELKEKMVCMHTTDPFTSKLILLMDRIPLQTASGDLNYQFKTIIKLNPEYEVYHLLYGKTKYDENKLHVIQECLRKKMSFDKIKYVLSICR